LQFFSLSPLPVTAHRLKGGREGRSCKFPHPELHESSAIVQMIVRIMQENGARRGVSLKA